MPSVSAEPLRPSGSETSTPPTQPQPHQPAQPTPVGQPPARLTIDRIGVAAPVVDLGLTDDGTLEDPTEWDDAGWYSGGPAPGDRGPAVIAGHVDSTTGPAVFYRLAELVPGDEIEVTSDNGTRSSFVVDRLERWPKDQFPTQQVYGLTEGPELRLITCGGSFDDESGHYQDNIVVYATMSTTGR